jgi:hypothetical protein
MTDHQPMSLSILARLIATETGDEWGQWRSVTGFIEGFRHLDHITQQALLNEPPTTTGDERWDTFLAALTEWEADQFALTRPGWTAEVAALNEPWVPTTLPSKAARAMMTSPEPFASRQVFLEPVDLTVA